MLTNRNHDRLKKEAVRYLGYGKNAVDERISALIDRAFLELESVVNPKCIYRIFDLNSVEQNQIHFSQVTIKSTSLGRNLKGCEKIVLFGATLGIGVDQLMARKAITDMAGAVIMQSCAAALLEEYCDECQERISEEVRKEGRFLRPRFSPGYGDFPIDFQGKLMQILDCAKHIGLTMTESYMMTPVKSVTAVIGVSATDAGCRKVPCEECVKKDCKYRRNRTVMKG